MSIEFIQGQIARTEAELAEARVRGNAVAIARLEAVLGHWHTLLEKYS